ncbi:PH domain-containing protein [Patescibacteria group bacterium]
MLATLTNSFIDKPKKIKFEGEDNDEEILYVFRKAPITNVGWIFTSIILLLAPLVFNTFLLSLYEQFPGLVKPFHVFILNAFWYVFSLGYAFERFLNWFFNVHIITNKRIIDMDFDHLLHRNVSEAPLRNIEDITYTVTGTLQTLFNFGSISIQTAAEKRELEFYEIANPAKIQDLLSDLVSAKRGPHGN